MNEFSSNPKEPSARSLHGAPESARRTEAVAGQERLLLSRVRSKDQTAMRELFDTYGGMVYSIALRILKDPGQAEDVMQDIFFAVWETPSKFVEGRGSLGAWLAVVARNHAIDTLRKRKNSDPVEEVVLVSSTNLASEIERNTMMERVRGVLVNLPPEQQRSVELAFFEGLTHSEIAERTGDALGTVKTRIRSALISVRKAIQG